MKDSSVIFSLQELKRLEEERVQQEKDEENKRREEAVAATLAELQEAERKTATAVATAAIPKEIIITKEVEKPVFVKEYIHIPAPQTKNLYLGPLLFIAGVCAAFSFQILSKKDVVLYTDTSTADISHDTDIVAAPVSIAPATGVPMPSRHIAAVRPHNTLKAAPCACVQGDPLCSCLP